jgi:hypothetical protein
MAAADLPPIPEMTLRDETLAAAILQGAELDLSGLVICRVHHAGVDSMFYMSPPDGDQVTSVDLWLTGDLPEASYRAEVDGRIVREGRLACWLDHTGGKLLGPAPADNPTGFGEYDRLNHRIMQPQRGQLIQAVSWCGHRVHEVPGRGPVDCPGCLEALAGEHP